MKYFPKSVTFNSNECDMRWDTQRIRRYVEIVRDLVDRGAKVDYMGIQMHILRPKLASTIAAGEPTTLNPEEIWLRLNILSEAERPIFISEVTISATDDSDEGRAIQKELTRNLYRIWFSHPSVAGITWWNMVDGGAVAGEPSYSGLFDMEATAICQAVELLSDIPVVVVKMVSDIPEAGDSTFSYDEFVDSHSDFGCFVDYLENLK